MSETIPRQRLQNHPGGEAMRDTGLDHARRLGVAHDAPDRAHQCGVAVIVAREALGTDRDALRPHAVHHFAPQRAEFAGGIGRHRAEKTIEVDLPLRIGRRAIGRPAGIFAALHHAVAQRVPQTDGIADQRAGGAVGIFQEIAKTCVGHLVALMPIGV